VTGRVTVRVEATSAAEAEESVSRTEILAALADLDRLDHLGCLDYEIGDATEA
jgi:hypothetical protein